MVSQILLEYLNKGSEERYLEYKGDIPWNDRHKRFEIVKTILAFTNLKDGGVIVVGVNKNNEKVGLSDTNYDSFDHDHINEYLKDKTNYPVECKIHKLIHENLKYVIIQVSESKEYPIIYTGKLELINEKKAPFPGNIALRPMALYIRGRLNICSKEIESIDEWQEIIEQSLLKYKQETIRRTLSNRLKEDNYKIKYSL